MSRWSAVIEAAAFWAVGHSSGYGLRWFGKAGRRYLLSSADIHPRWLRGSPHSVEGAPIQPAEESQSQPHQPPCAAQASQEQMMRIKLPLGPIAKWVGNVVLAAAAQAIVDRLSRPKPKVEPAPAYDDGKPVEGLAPLSEADNKKGA